MPRKRVPVDYGPKWGAALMTAQKEGAICDLHDVAPQVWRCRAGRLGWDYAARIVAAKLPGGMVTHGGDGLTWRSGSAWGGSCVNIERYEDVLQSREIVWELMREFGDFAGLPPGYKWPDPVDGAPPGTHDIKEGILRDVWTVGRCAKKVLAWIGSPDESPKKAYTGVADCVLYPLPPGSRKPQELAYHESYPGEYDAGVLWDVKQAYPSLMARIADGRRFSLRPRPYKAGRNIGVRWGQWRAGERERFREAVEATAENYTLARALWGAALGSYDWRVSYAPDGAGGTRRIVYPGSPGPFRPLALVVARTMRDIVHQQAGESASLYGTVDSVLIANECLRPRVLESHGLIVVPKHTGAWDIRGRGAWGVYRKGVERPPQDATGKAARDWVARTDPYKRASRYAQPIPRVEQTSFLHRAWLA